MRSAWRSIAAPRHERPGKNGCGAITSPAVRCFARARSANVETAIDSRAGKFSSRTWDPSIVRSTPGISVRPRSRARAVSRARSSCASCSVIARAEPKLGRPVDRVRGAVMNVIAGIFAGVKVKVYFEHVGRLIPLPASGLQLPA
jgi:hypothetical protein